MGIPRIDRRRRREGPASKYSVVNMNHFWSEFGCPWVISSGLSTEELPSPFTQRIDHRNRCEGTANSAMSRPALHTLLTWSRGPHRQCAMQGPPTICHARPPKACHARLPTMSTAAVPAMASVLPSVTGHWSANDASPTSASFTVACPSNLDRKVASSVCQATENAPDVAHESDS